IPDGIDDQDTRLNPMFARVSFWPTSAIVATDETRTTKPASHGALACSDVGFRVDGVDRSATAPGPSSANANPNQGTTTGFLAPIALQRFIDLIPTGGEVDAAFGSEERCLDPKLVGTPDEHVAQQILQSRVREVEERTRRHRNQELAAVIQHQ